MIATPQASCKTAPGAARIVARAAFATLLAHGFLQNTAPAQQRPASKPEKPTHTYWVYAGAESADIVQRIRFGADGIVVEKTIPVGELPSEVEGPHGLAISPDGQYLYVTTGHGEPNGRYWRYALGPDTLVGDTFLGRFPASIDVTPDGLYTLSSNFNLYGDMVPSSLSVVYTPTNTEVARIVTCVMPHGSRVTPDGLRQYSTCMMDDQLVEVDTRSFAVSRRFALAQGKEGPLAADSGRGAGHGPAHGGAGQARAGQVGAGHGDHNTARAPVDPAEAGHPGGSGARHGMPPATCSPTWAQPSADGKKVFVACNKADEIIEIDRDRWAITRRLKTGRGPYNLAVTPDGKLLIATLKQGAKVEVFDAVSGKSLGQLPTSTTLAHGVVVSPDSRYAFVTSEGVGAAPGKVDVYDLRTLTRVGAVDVGQQASGIAFWKLEPAAGR
jgi:DNA-binding beta-propeller fold protein YncE